MTAAAQTAVSERRGLTTLAALAVVLVFLTAAAPHLHRLYGGWVLIGAFAVSAIGAFSASRLDLRQRPALILILAAAAGMRVAMLMTEPYLSSDIYRYIWDGRVQAAGINPYRYLPQAPELAFLRDSTIFPNINRAEYAPTIYPPVAQLVFLAITRLGESVLAMRVGLIACEAVILASLLYLLGRAGAPATRIAAYAWHPLPIWEIAGNGHIDAAMIALMMLGLSLNAAGRALFAPLAIALGALVKPTAALALPALWKPWDWRLPLVVAASLTFAYLPYLSVGWGVFGYLSGYVNEEGLARSSSYKLLELIESLTGELPYAGAVYIVVGVLLLFGFAVAAAFRHDRSEAATLRAANWLLIAFLVLSSPHYPWYFLVLVPFLALNATATAWVLTVAGVLFYNAVPDVGPLPSYEARIHAFTLLMLLALAFDSWACRRKASAIGEAT